MEDQMQFSNIHLVGILGEKKGEAKVKEIFENGFF